ncbi:MAG: hypothetical protein AAGU05_01485, partial [Anaerolineaceae bacterium]
MPTLALLIILTAAILVILFILALLLLRTFKRPPAARPVEKIQPAQVDSLNLAAHLAEVIQCQTVSQDPSARRVIEDELAAADNPFAELREILHENYPLVSRMLLMERINDDSLLFTWRGSQP